MSERVRILHFEAADVRELVARYWRDRGNDTTRGDLLAEDLVNAIGEIYRAALARRTATRRPRGTAG